MDFTSHISRRGTLYINIFISLPSFGSPFFPLSSLFVVISFCLLHFHFHFLFLLSKLCFAFVLLFYLSVYLGCWRSEHKKTYVACLHMIETLGLLVDPRRRYHFYICPGGPTWISSASCSNSCAPKFEVRLNCDSMVVNLICVKLSTHFVYNASPDTLNIISSSPLSSTATKT